MPGDRHCLEWACKMDLYPNCSLNCVCKLGLPGNHKLGYVDAFGLPEVHYHRTVQGAGAGCKGFVASAIKIVHSHHFGEMESLPQNHQKPSDLLVVRTSPTNERRPLFLRKVTFVIIGSPSWTNFELMMEFPTWPEPAIGNEKGCVVVALVTTQGDAPACSWQLPHHGLRRLTLTGTGCRCYQCPWLRTTDDVQ
jgi:hypothetical protein